MKKFILLGFCSLMSCKTIDNPLNCRVTPGCLAASFCDFDTEKCKPNFTLQDTRESPNFKDATQLVIEDMDGDIQEDIVIKNQNMINICYGAKAGKVQCITPLTYTLDGPNFMRIVDLNHNEKHSILVVPQASTNKVGQFFHSANTSPPSFTGPNPYLLGVDRINDMIPVDRNSTDGGASDLWLATSGGVYILNFIPSPVLPMSPYQLASFSTLVQTRTQVNTTNLQVVGILTAGGVGVLERAAVTANNVSDKPITSLRTGSIAGDQTLDLIGATDGGKEFYYSLGRATDRPNPPTAIPSVSAISKSFEIADLFSSGNQGLVVLSDKRTFAYLPGNGDGKFQAQTAVLQANDDISLFAVKDINGDGRPDIVYITATGVLQVAINDKVHELVQVSDAL